MTGTARARKPELGAIAEPALYVGIDEGMVDGAGCCIMGVECMGAELGATYMGAVVMVGIMMGVV